MREEEKIQRNEKLNYKTTKHNYTLYIIKYAKIG